MDVDFLPSPTNAPFLKALNDKKVVPEISAFNAEINADPCLIRTDCLQRLHEDLIKIWQRIDLCCESLETEMLMIGSLPTIRDYMLKLDFISANDRYHLLNERIMALRDNQPLKVSIDGIESLDLLRHDIMLESAATSLQIHLQVEFENMTRTFNAAQLASVPMVAACANSPFLFGKETLGRNTNPYL